MNESLPAIQRAEPLDLAPQGSIPWSMGPASDPYGPDDEGFSWRRQLSAIGRQKWLVAISVLIGAIAAAAGWFLTAPQYESRATLWVETPTDRRSGPIRSAELLQEYAWLDLLASPPVLIPVVHEQRLFIVPEAQEDETVLAGFRITDDPWPGTFRVTVDSEGEGYTLATKNGEIVETGVVGDSVGRGVGFLWRPARGSLTPGRTIDFTVLSPGEAAKQLAEDLSADMTTANFLHIKLKGKDPRRITAVVNSIADEHTRQAIQLKRQRADDLVSILTQQASDAHQNLRHADIALENFRIRTITLPSDRPTMVGDMVIPTNPVLQQYFEKQLRIQAIAEDAAKIRAALSGPDGPVVERLELIPSVQNSTQLRAAMIELTESNASLRQLRYRYTDEHPAVLDTLEKVQTLKTQTIPTLAQTILESLAAESSQLDVEVRSTAGQLEEVPARTAEEARLAREAEAANNLYTEISERLEVERLAAASTIPDVRIFSRADIPQFPLPDTRLRTVAMALIGGLLVGLFGAILLDRIDPRVQYPEQVTSEIGLPILGSVPPIKHLEGKRGDENTEQVVEAFRELRLNLLYAYGQAGPGPLLLTITSPGSGDGKSLITANLGVAFAELGRRTLIIDGDARRGDIHQLLGRHRKPGLTDYLAGQATRSEIIQETEYEALNLISSGSRLTHAPELLGSAEMRELFADLRTQYSVILVDSPPLGAGSDAFLLGTLSGHLVMVLRTGTTNKELTLARLAPLARLPIRILGAILNDVQPEGIYRYYSSYLPGYGTGREEAVGSRTPALRAADE